MRAAGNYKPPEDANGYIASSALRSMERACFYLAKEVFAILLTTPRLELPCERLDDYYYVQDTRVIDLARGCLTLALYCGNKTVIQGAFVIHGRWTERGAVLCFCFLV